MIYFITAREIGRVKIGFSEDPRTRFVKMQVDSPCVLKLERTMDGGVETERAIHVRFYADRIRGEWFTLSANIKKFMRGCDDATPAPRPVMNRNDDSALINQLGAGKVSQTFGLSPQALHMWRRRGIPLAKRIAFAKMCADAGVIPPADFFAAFEVPPPANQGKAA